MSRDDTDVRLLVAGAGLYVGGQLEGDIVLSIIDERRGEVDIRSVDEYFPEIVEGTAMQTDGLSWISIVGLLDRLTIHVLPHTLNLGRVIVLATGCAQSYSE